MYFISTSSLRCIWRELYPSRDFLGQSLVSSLASDCPRNWARRVNRGGWCIRPETLDHRILVNLHAPPCCAIVGDLGSRTTVLTQLPGQGVTTELKRMKKKRKKKKKRRNASHSPESLPRFHGLMTFLRPLVAGQKDALWSLAAAFLR